MKSEVINIKTPVSRVGNKTAILHILYALFPLHYGRFIDVFGAAAAASFSANRPLTLLRSTTTLTATWSICSDA